MPAISAAWAQGGFFGDEQTNGQMQRRGFGREASFNAFRQGQLHAIIMHVWHAGFKDWKQV